MTGSNNYTNYSSPIIENSFSIHRFDHAITDKQKIFGRYSLNNSSPARPNLYGSSSPNFVISSPTAGNDFLRQQQATIDYTNPFKPNAILQANSSYIRYFIGRSLPVMTSIRQLSACPVISLPWRQNTLHAFRLLAFPV